MYRIAEIIGVTMSLIGFIAHIINEVGIAITMESKEAIDIRVNEYCSPGNSWSDLYKPTNASHTESGDGINSGVVIIEAICQMMISITTPEIFFKSITFKYLSSKGRGCIIYP
jgi:hypothetical protein